MYLMMDGSMKWPPPLHRLGYTSSQVEEICKLEGLTKDQVAKALGPITMAYDDKLGVILYPHDLELGISICHRGYPMIEEEWD